MGGEEVVESVLGGEEGIEDFETGDGDVGGDVLEPLLAALDEDGIVHRVDQACPDLGAQLGVILDPACNHPEEAHAGLDEGGSSGGGAGRWTGVTYGVAGVFYG